MRFLDIIPKSSFVKGGWVDVDEALRHVRKDLHKTYKEWAVDEIASVHWLHGLLRDVGPSVKSRFQLAGVVDEDRYVGQDLLRQV